jgi:CheY-like chemotaxis protein
VSKEILWIEDDADLLISLMKQLEESDYKITIAYTEYEALELLEKKAFDLIILDILIPSAIDGEEYTEFVGMRLLDKISSRNIPIIALTVVGEPEVINNIKGYSVKYLPKGQIYPDTLLHEVEDLLR